jgi:hypothetical protein
LRSIEPKRVTRGSTVLCRRLIVIFGLHRAEFYHAEIFSSFAGARLCEKYRAAAFQFYNQGDDYPDGKRNNEK